ncbi:hypothetical protein CANCADRAFT_212 [Tortispora caseinolytica NRRL Y-17796]|uniref:Methyltransferase type 11 domain-containing protein n=1 Tax=Tortispora caseinolytica NRRL Y-17796 TaxID=767744 RepID=A0A1E4TIP8_9ASCO|nr:hypothetical protein CANCADRAFT_212 [Tortispora caseinolytica NRRL Y-17796]
MSRPEQEAPPEIFYNDSEASKYTGSSRIQRIQAEMTLRALDLLSLPPSSYILDIGCGSGLSGEILSEEGHYWVGMDISPSMLQIALERDVDGDILLSDMGQGVPFRPGSFDAAISISAIQWLCNVDSSEHDPKYRLSKFFQTLFSSLKRGGRAVFQFYPANDTQRDTILHAAKVAGFTGGLVIDDPESKKNKKYYMVLVAGGSPGDINLDGVAIDNTMKQKSKKSTESRKQYIMRKKELMKRRGERVAKDSKYTGRKRRTRF